MGLRAKLLGATAAVLLAVNGAQAADLALKRVLLSTAGLGLFEYEADVEGDAAVELKVRRDQVDDVLKSLVVFDDHGGVGGLDLASAEPLAETFRSLPFTAADLQSAPQLLTALRGAEVEIDGTHAIKGRIVAVAAETAASADGKAVTTRHRVTVMSEAGLEQFVLEQADSVRFADPAVRAAIAKALAAVAASGDRESRTLRLTAKGEGKRTLRVAYLSSAPVWKTTYRLVLDPAPDAKKATLQGWATLENLSGQDWSGVDLTLVSGRPVAYRQELYRAYMIQRPEAPLDIGAALTPEVDRGAMAVDKPESAAAAPTPMPFAKRAVAADAVAAAPAEPAPPPRMAVAAVAAAAQEGETQVSFHLPFPVSVGNGRTLSLPIVDAEAPVQRIDLFDPNVDGHHPLSAVSLTNAGGAALPPGIVTIYERGAADAAYVGDSQLAGTPPGEKRLLSYALDQKTTIEQDDSDKSSLARIRIAKGVLTVDELLRRRTLYKVKAAAPRRLLVFAPKLEGGHLTEPKAADATEADGRLRVPFDIAATDGRTYAVTQERIQQQLVALADLDDANLAVYAKSGAIDADSRALLGKLADLREKQATAERALQAGQSRVEAVTDDQTRLKELMSAAPAGSDLSKRYLKKLDDDESQLEALRATQAELPKGERRGATGGGGFYRRDVERPP